MIKFASLFLVGSTLLAAAAANAPQQASCKPVLFEQVDYIVCRFDPAQTDIRLFHADESGVAYRHFNRLNAQLSKSGEALLFAMNAGMYNRARDPIGLYIDADGKKKSANTNDGPGNFHLKPNGVFFIDGDKAGVQETQSYLNEGRRAQYATQSGPMLVINGGLHPKFLEKSASRKRRNGVGVTAAGEVVFVLADDPVNFHTFGRFFLEELETPNALYLDGTISRIYASDLGRNDPGVPMGPIVGVVARN